ncbi:hypothetical protein HD554DRAFT_299997 [Boletus coccyginus]|nr:hypothetical protein HD554DRAFT_299997 [Boletus coccyginus]
MSKNCTTSSPNLNAQPIGTRIASMKPSTLFVRIFARGMKARVRPYPPRPMLHSPPCPLGGRITHLEQTIQELHVQLAEAERKADRLIRINHAHEQKDQCESMYAQGRIHVAAKCLLEIVNTVNNDVRTNKFIFDWLPGVFQRRTSRYNI